jgi:hypothetical protein
MKTLELNFNNTDQQKVAECLAAMKEKHPTFTVSQSGVSHGDMISKPEYIDVKDTVILTFQKDNDCRNFMDDAEMQEVFQKFAAA